MKPFIIALTLYLFVNISSCSTNDAPIVEPPNGETAEDSNTPTMNEQIRIIIGNASFTATLEDNATTKAFKASLPITVNMTEQAGNEKFYYLPTALPTSTVTPGTIFAGDLMLWGNSCLVLFQSVQLYANRENRQAIGIIGSSRRQEHNRDIRITSTI